MMTMNARDATFRHRPDVDRDLDLHLRLDPDRPVSVARGASEMTSSSSSTSRNAVQQTGATPDGLSNKLKMKLLGRATTVNEAPAPANHSSSTGHVDKHGGERDVTSNKQIGCLDKVASESEHSKPNAGLDRTVTTSAEETNLSASFNFRPGDEYFDFPCKFHCPSQRHQFANFDSEQTEFLRGKLVSSLSRRDDPDGATLSTPIVSDRSPLIQHASSPPPLIVDATAFDNEAVIAETTPTSAMDRKLTDSPSEPEIGRSVVGKEAPASSRKKRKVLSIMIPSRESSSSGGGMRQLSASEERKIDDALRLASSFARLTTQQEPLTPRSTGSASSKESLDSPAPATGGHVFRFAGLRRKVVGKEEKRTFLDGLSLTCNATDIVTPDAQAAYNQLVSVSAAASAPSTMTTKLPTRRFDARRAHRSLNAPLPSTLRRRCLHKPASQTTHSRYQRSASLTEDSIATGARTARRIDLRSLSSSESTLSPASAETSHTNDDDLTCPPLHRAPSPPPPALPPRVPLRRSAGGPRRRACVPAKQRSVSQVHEHSVSADVTHAARRGGSEVTDSTMCDVHVSLDSNDDVFVSTLSDNDDITAMHSTHKEDSDDVEDAASGRSSLRRSPAGRLDVVELGLYDPVDAFWNRRVDLTSLSRSEQDLLEQLDHPTMSAGNCGFGSSDAVSYEDLMDFALDGPRHSRLQSEGGECDEVRLMRRLLTSNVTVDECMDALSSTQWDVHDAIKLIKLSQLLNTGLANKQTCKRALMTCQWDVQDAARFLLNGRRPASTDDA